MEKRQSKFKNRIYISDSIKNCKKNAKKTLILSSSTTNLHSKYNSSAYIKHNDNQNNLTNSRNNFAFIPKKPLHSIKYLETEPNHQNIKLSNKNHHKESSKPLHTVKSSTYLRKNKTFQDNNKRIIQTPKTDNNSFIVNNLTYYIRCPHCRHVLNEQPKQIKEINKIYNKLENNDKENLDENIQKIIREHTYGSNSNLNEIKIIYKNYDIKNYYLNERGGVVFKSQDGPVNSILIVHHRDYSRYQKETKILGKKQNIGIYEAPVPKKKVFIRPINI